jgi:ferredoxin
MKSVSEPTYTHDIVGKIQRVDERSNVFARYELFQYFGSENLQYKTFYQAHPDIMEEDRYVNKMPPINRSGGIDLPMFKAQFNLIEKIAREEFVDGFPSDPKLNLSSERASEKIKALGKILGADLVGIGPLRQEWVYSYVGRSQGNASGRIPLSTPINLSQHTSAIALGFQMDTALMSGAPDFPVQLATAKGYSMGAWSAVQLAEYIRQLGYSARAHHLYNYQVLAVPVAIDCGLGELSRAGYLITPQYGLAIRLSIVTTSMPLAFDSPIDIAAQSFCKQCKICARSCPVGAIPEGEKSEHNGILKWKLDEQKCWRYWHSVGTHCGMCMASCPWNNAGKGGLHQLAVKLASIPGPHQYLMGQSHLLLNGKYHPLPPPEFLGDK